MIAKYDKAPDAANVGAIEQTTTQIKADLSIITSISPQTLTKTKRLGDDGTIITDTVAHMSQGMALNTTISSAKQLADVLDGLEHNQAVTWGVHTGRHDVIKLLSTKLYNEQGEPAGALTRTNKHFTWGDHCGVMMLDCDVKGLTKEQFIKAINDVMPLDDIAHVWRPSSSSYIYNGNEQMDGLAGQRLYIFIQNADDIERAGKTLFDRLWLGGHGHYEISAAGGYLERSPIDGSVFQPSRLDFAAGANCITPLNQRMVNTDHQDGAALDSAGVLLDLSVKELNALSVIKDQAKTECAGEVHAVRERYSHAKALTNLAKQGIDDPTAEQLSNARNNVLRALTAGSLTGDFIIQLADGEAVSIGEVLDDPSHYHNKETKDPLEPEYNGGKTVGQLYIYGQRPVLFSQAHGGMTYKLLRQPRNIEHESGKTFETTQRTLDLMRALPDYYDMGDNLVSVKDGHIIPFSEPLLGYELGGIAQYWQKTNHAPYERLIDPPLPVIKQIIAMHRQRNLKQLNAVITAPTITDDDHIVTKQGYDTKTKLYLDCLGHGVDIPEFVDIDDAVAAYHALMKPFNTFDYADGLSRSVALSAILTAVTRPTQATAPAFAFDAPKQGSGKTYFCECLGLLATGDAPAMTPSIENNEDEVRKTLLAMLLEGRRFIIWDNIMNAFNSATMAAFLTAEHFSGRILGATKNVEVSHRAMLLLTGNNITLVGDMPRRVLICRFDTGLENPTQAQRDLSAIDGLKPAAYIEQNRYKLAAAAITLIRGYLQSDAHQSGGAVSDKLSSFEQWDTIARQPIVWLSNYVNGLTDPKQTIDDSMDKDPEHETLSDMLNGIYEWQRCAIFTARQLFDHAKPNDDFGMAEQSLFETLNDLNGGKKLTSRSVGNLLKHRRGRIANGLKLEQVKATSQGNCYRLIEI